jgi:hypothetical protein
VSSWLRLFPCTTEKKHHADLKQLCPTLDIGSHINTVIQPPSSETVHEAVHPLPATVQEEFLNCADVVAVFQ